MRNRFLILILITALVLAVPSCKKSSDTPSGKPAGSFTLEGLDRGFVVSALKGSKPIEIVEGVDLAFPPYDFFLTLTNPTDQNVDITFHSSNKAGLELILGDVTIFRYRDRYPGETEVTVQTIHGKNKRAWELRWDGKLADGSYPANGVYTLGFVLNTEPPTRLEVTGVKLTFTGTVDEDDEETAADDDQGSGDRGTIEDWFLKD